MGQSPRRVWLRPRLPGPRSIAALAALGLVLPATAGATGIAAASPAAGYTASLIPTGQASSTVAVNPVTDTVYFGDVGDGKVRVVDGGTDTVTATIAVPDFPTGIAVNPVTDTVYILVPQTSTSLPAVEVIDGATNAIAATITLPSGSGTGGIAVDSTTNTVYVSEPGVPAVAVIDGSTNKVTATVSTGTGTAPAALAVDEATDVVWVADLNGHVLAISGTTNTVTKTINVSVGVGNVESVAVDRVSDTVYAAVIDSGVAVGGVTVINGTTGSVTTTISIQALYWVAVDPDTGTLFASSYVGSDGSGTTWVIDTSSNAIVDTIGRGGVDIAVDTATGSAYEAAYYAQVNGAWVLAPSASNAMSPVIVGTAGTLTEGAAGSITINGTALPAATYTETGALPAGVTLSPSGVLSGTPALSTVGTYPITLTASNGIPPDYSQSFTLTIAELPTITAPASTTFQVGTAVSEPIQVTGFPAPLVAAYSLPARLRVVQPVAGQWELTGTPAAGSGGVHNVSFYATNAAGTADVTVPITVLEAPSITSAPTATFLTGRNNNFVVSADCYPACTLAETGALPQGVTLSPAGVLSGSPPLGTEGTYQFTVTASNSLGTVTQAFTLTLERPPPATPAVAVGAESTNGAMYVQAPQLPPGWHSEGGKIVGPPAVAAPPNPDGGTWASPLFVATGTNKLLYIRGLTGSWQRLGPQAGSCLGSPAAVITGTAPNYTVTVACEGTNRALYYNTATLGSGLPQFTSGWKSLGGVLTAGPAVAPVGGVMTFFVRGTTGRIYTRTENAGYAEMPWACIGAPSAGLQAATGVTVFACQGTNHALHEATSTGGGWTPAVSLGGSLIGGPAVAATSEAIVLFGEGTSHAVYRRTPATGWTSLGSSVVDGVGAAALN